MFELSPPDFLYSVYRPDLAAIGATDGRPLSGLPQDNNDPLSRRDMGLEFLDVTNRVTIERIATAREDDAHLAAAELRDEEAGDRHEGEEQRVFRITNNGTRPVDTHLLVIASGLSFQIEMTNATGRTSTGDPYQRVFLPDGVLAPGQSIDVSLRFKRHRQSPPVGFTLKLLSGQGNP